MNLPALLNVQTTIKQLIYAIGKKAEYKGR